MRVEEFVGQRIRDRRDELGLTQEEFGRRVGHFLGRPWSRSTVSVAENGKRAFTAAELLVIATVLQTRAARLLTPPVSVAELDMPSGATLSTRMAPDIGIADPYLSRMWDHLAEVVSGTEQAHQAAKRAQDELLTAIGIAETATMYSDRAHPARELGPDRQAGQADSATGSTEEGTQR